MTSADFCPVTLIHDNGGVHEVDTEERLRSFLEDGWKIYEVPKPEKAPEAAPVKKARKKAEK